MVCDLSTGLGMVTGDCGVVQAAAAAGAVSRVVVGQQQHSTGYSEEERFTYCHRH